MADRTESRDKGNRVYSLIAPEAYDATSLSEAQAERAIQREKARSNQVATEQTPAGDPTGNGMAQLSPQAPGAENYALSEETTLDPLLERSIRENSEAPRQVAVLGDGVAIIPEKGADMRRRLQSLDQYSSSMMNPAAMQEVMEKLEQARKDLVEEIEWERTRASGARRNERTYLKEMDLKFKSLNVVSSASAMAYSPFHKMSTYFEWGIFKTPPTTLMQEQKKRIEEVRRQARYSDKLASEMEKKLTQFDATMREIRTLHQQLSGEPDPRNIVRLASSAFDKVKLARTQLNEGVSTDDPALKAEWDAMRKEVTKGLAGLDKQLAYTETALHAAEKTIIVAGAIATNCAYGRDFIRCCRWNCRRNFSWSGRWYEPNDRASYRTWSSRYERSV